jgi:hypothetical protein
MSRIFKTWEFQRWMRKTDLTNSALVRAVREMERGLIDADLGEGVLKKRVALPGRGKRGSVRTVVASNLGERWIFLNGYKKNEKGNITVDELHFYRAEAKTLLEWSNEQLEAAVALGEFEEIGHEN